jgi:glycosidase
MDVGPGGKFSPREWSLADIKSIVHKWQTCMYDNGGWNALFLENHDQSRSVSRFTPHRPENRAAAAKMLATFVGLQAGTLFVYQGQELGMANLPEDWDIGEYKDFETQNLYRLYVLTPWPPSRPGFAYIWENNSAMEQHGDAKAVEQLMDQIRLKARDHSRSPMQVCPNQTTCNFSSQPPLSPC